MNEQGDKDKRLEELRKKAEKKLQLYSEKQAQAAAENESSFKRLIYELQVHQVELEMQNEELLRTRLDIEKSRNEFADLYNFAPIHYFTLDNQGHIIKLNLLAAQMLGYDRKFVHHKRLVNFISPEYAGVYTHFFKKIQQTASRQTLQVELMDRSGKKRMLHLQGIPSWHLQEKVELLSGEVQEILMTAIDITDLKKAEAEARQAERFRHIIEGIPGIYLFLAPDHVVLEASNDYLRTFHREREKVVGYTLSELFHPVGAQDNLSVVLMQSLIQVTYHQSSHTTPVLRYDIVLPDGRKEERYWRITNSPVLNKVRQVDYIIHQMSDVTREYLAQQEIESSRQRFEMLAFASNDVVWEWNIITGLWWWNQNLESHFGYNRNSLEPGMEAWSARIHPDDKEQAVACLVDTIVRGLKECRQEYRFQRADGTYAYILDRSYALQEESGKTLRMLGTMVDITEQKEAELALRKINERFRVLLETIPQLAWISEPDGHTIFYNRKWYAYTGANSNDLKNSGWQQYLHPEDTDQTCQAWETALQTGQTAVLQGRWRQASTGQYRWHIGQIIPVYDEKGHITNWVGSLTDIHAQKLVEEALRDNAELRETQRKLQVERDFSRSLVDNSIDGIFTFDTTPCYTSWNPVLEHIYAISRENVVGKKIFELFPEYESTEEGQAILQVLKGEKTTLYKQPYDNKEGFYELNLIPLRSNTGHVIGGLGIMHDVTEQIKLEEERTSLKLKRQKELLNTILDAQEGERKRIAEALHNSLAQTLYAAKLQLEQMPVEQANRKQLIDIKQTATTMLANAIQETRKISHELIPAILEDFGLKGAINDFCKKYTHSALAIKTEIYGLDERIDKHLEIAIYRITQELVNNAIKHAHANHLHLHLVKGELGILLKVADNGKGFNADTILQSIKGIGLKTIQDRVKLLNGTIDIDSAPDSGTAVTIKIPLA